MTGANRRNATEAETAVALASLWGPSGLEPGDGTSLGTHRVICAWCRVVLGPGSEPTSHGICPRCAEGLRKPKDFTQDPASGWKAALALLLLLVLAIPAVAEETCHVTTANASCVFDSGGALLVAALTPGDYTRQDLGLMLEGALWAADNGQGIYQVYFYPSTAHHTIDRLDAGAGPGLLNLRVSASPLCWALFGFTGTDRTGALLYESNVAPYCPRPRPARRTAIKPAREIR